MPSKRHKKSAPVESSVKHEDDDDAAEQNSPPKRRRRSKSTDPTPSESDPDPSSPSSPHRPPQNPPLSPQSALHPKQSRNPAGKPAEAGIIQKVSLENFMCHKKFTVEFCRNVNFIHGQNGSGKSAILAAVQICLGAGAKRTHRARNLKELVRKEGDAGSAKVRVTLLNRGEDAFRPDLYGETVTVERSISLRGGYNGYKLLDHKSKEQSRSKKDLDALLDQLNIQVENPVAVLDQEEAKKFLCGKAEDKYHFFTKATELERLDRSYASVVDHIFELDESNAKIKHNMNAALENVKYLKAEWDKFQALENLEDKLSNLRVSYSWSFYHECYQKLLCETDQQTKFQKVQLKRRQELDDAESHANVDSTEQEKLQEVLGELTAEAQRAKAQKVALEEDRRLAQQPLRQLDRALKRTRGDRKMAERRLGSATRDLQTTRADIMRRAGSAESEERKRMERIGKAEQEMGEENGRLERVKKDIKDYLAKYDELEPREHAAVDASVKAGRQLFAVKKRLEEMKAGEGNSLAMFGPKCVAMHRRVEQAKKEGRFTGTVVGPIGMYLKIASGKELLASLAELSLGFGVLDRFIVTNDRDRSYFMKLRNDLRCASRDCGVFQMHEGPRYPFKPPPSDDVETVASVLNVEHDLVLNCLIDNCRTDQVALMNSKDSSEKALLHENENRSYSIRGGNIKQVFYLPKGDFWRVTKGGELSVISMDKKLRQTIGVDRTEAIRESERDIDQLTIEARQLKQEETNVKKERSHFKLKWNEAQQIMNRTTKKITSLKNTIDDIAAQAEEAVNFTAETTDLEDEVRKAEEECNKLKENEEEHKKAMLDLQPELDNIQSQLEEISARNEKVVKEILTCEHSLKEFMRNQTERTRLVGKKRKRLQLVEEAISKQTEVVHSRTEAKEESLGKARLLTYQNNKVKEAKRRKTEGFEEVEEEPISEERLSEELKNIQPVEGDKKPDYFKNKILRAQRDLGREREKRQLAESDPLVAFEKYQRAQNDFDSKMEQIDKIEDTIASLKEDVRERKDRWKKFRSHIGNMTNDTFDEMLNKKGSSGQIEFDHKNNQLNLIVQKDNRDEHSQTKDVKALSGGERSFTTLSLLLALGESLETPFRVMDEFDVFLDPMSRKIALDTMVQVAKGLEHRQFIFITPQDLSNLKTDPMLKIHRMKPPPRSAVVGGAAQQTLNFE